MHMLLIHRDQQDVSTHLQAEQTPHVSEGRLVPACVCNTDVSRVSTITEYVA